MTEAKNQTPAEQTPPVAPVSRADALARVKADPLWDVVIIGAGATGAGIAVDAASRGLSTLLLDAQDFTAGTSSRSTKLIHGGVRYMKNPRDWGLVSEALHERRVLIANAPHLVHAESFVLPCFRKWEREIYAAGLGLYAAMAGAASLGRTRLIKADEAAKRLPGVRTEGLLGGVEFHDAQFDDARLGVALVRTAVTHGAAAVNYMPVTAIERTGGLIQSVTAEDKVTGESLRIRARAVFNCAGVWADRVRRMVDPEAPLLLRCSRGSHILLDREFLPGESGMLIPKTRDGRVLFCIPWHGMTLVGTTDVEQREPDMNPLPADEEIDFLLETAAGYLSRPLSRADVRASFAGLRPLLRGPEGGSTAQASRTHAVIPEFGNMITVAGGKWTSYRRMAEDAMLEATKRHLVAPRLCVTKTLPIVHDDAFDPEAIEAAAAKGPGADADVVAYALHCRDCEGALTAEDVLFRRLRLGQMNAERTAKLLPIVEAAMKGEPYELELVPEAPEEAPQAAQSTETAAPAQPEPKAVETAPAAAVAAVAEASFEKAPEAVPEDASEEKAPGAAQAADAAPEAPAATPSALVGAPAAPAEGTDPALERVETAIESAAAELDALARDFEVARGEKAAEKDARKDGRTD